MATPWTTKLREQRVLIDSDGVKLKQKVKLYLTTDEKMWLKNNVEKEGGGCLHTLPEAKRLLKLGHRLRKVQALYIIIMKYPPCGWVHGFKECSDFFCS